MKKYNGWENYETWNVMLWLRETESLCSVIQNILTNSQTSLTYRELIYLLCLEDTKTGDGVAFINDNLNYEELNEGINQWR